MGSCDRSRGCHRVHRIAEDPPVFLTLVGSDNRCVRKRALRPNHVWSYDFIEDCTEKNRKLRMLVVIDEFTRESLAIEVAWSWTARQVVDVLGCLFAVRGIPEHLRSDNGPEFVARAVTGSAE